MTHLLSIIWQFQYHPALRSAYFRAWYVGQKKFWSTKESALANIFLFISFLRESVWYVRFFSTWHFQSFSFVYVWVFILLLLYTDVGTKKTAPYWSKWLNKGAVLTFMNFKHFLDARTSLLCFQVILFRHSNQCWCWVFAKSSHAL